MSQQAFKRVLLGFLDFSYKVNVFGLFCGDNIILWPNLGTNMMGIFVKTQVG